MEATVSDLNPVRLLSAARRVATLLSEIGTDLSAHQGAALPHAMARYISDDLSSGKLMSWRH